MHIHSGFTFLSPPLVCGCRDRSFLFFAVSLVLLFSLLRYRDGTFVCVCVYVRQTAALSWIAADTTRLEQVMRQPAFKRLSREQCVDVLQALTPSGKNGKGTKRPRVDDEDDTTESAAVTGAGSGGGGHALDSDVLTHDSAKRLRVDELKTALQARGLPTGGVKADLIARLQADIASPL
jgi:hypothetical protein